MRVGVYIDGFNMYFGARALCGRSTTGWRWVNVRCLVEASLPREWVAGGATIERLVYCTARVSGKDDPTSPRDQDVYLRALKASGSADEIEFGNFVRRTKVAPLAERDGKNRAVLATSRWPVMVHDSSGTEVPEARFLVSYLHREEKGSDVNVATHLLIDMFAGRVDAAIVVSNDSDLQLPVQRARERLPVGIVNPGDKPLAGGPKERAKCPGGETLVGYAASPRLHRPPNARSGREDLQAKRLVAKLHQGLQFAGGRSIMTHHSPGPFVGRVFFCLCMAR